MTTRRDYELLLETLNRHCEYSNNEQIARHLIEEGWMYLPEVALFKEPGTLTGESRPVGHTHRRPGLTCGCPVCSEIVKPLMTSNIDWPDVPTNNDTPNQETTFNE